MAAMGADQLRLARREAEIGPAAVAGPVALGRLGQGLRPGQRRRKLREERRECGIGGGQPAGLTGGPDEAGRRQRARARHGHERGLREGAGGRAVLGHVPERSFGAVAAAAAAGAAPQGPDCVAMPMPMAAPMPVAIA